MLYMIIWNSYYYIFYLLNCLIISIMLIFITFSLTKSKNPFVNFISNFFKILTPVKGLIHSEHWHTLKYQMRTCKYSIFHY